MDMSIKHTKHILIAVSYLLLIFHLTAHANDSDSTFKIPKGDGLLLLDIQVDAPSAVMTLQGARDKRMEVKLIPNNGRWLMQPLPKGEYQILNIKVPYFDLPYMKDTEKNPGWRIKIKAGRLNYAGRIEVEKERTADYVSIKKLNRLITDLPDIQKDLAAILVDYPLVDGNYLRDDFTRKNLETGVSHD